jgi:hypothetical protein
LEDGVKAGVSEKRSSVEEMERTMLERYKKKRRAATTRAGLQVQVRVR